MIYLSIACFAFLGGIIRYLISLILNQQQFPFATILVNLLGCFLIAFLTQFLINKKVPLWLQKGLLTGFLGAFTTLSTFNLDTYHLWQTNNLQAILYISITIFGGFIMIIIGDFLSSVFK